MSTYTNQKSSFIIIIDREPDKQHLHFKTVHSYNNSRRVF